MRRRDFVHHMVALGATSAVVPRWLQRAGITPPAGVRTRLDDGWRFHRGDVPGGERPLLDDSAWDLVRLPHTARLEALVTGPAGSATQQWQGLCWYRLPLRVGADAAGKKVFLHFEAAMNVAEVWLDGHRVGGHMGGFLPFVLDVTDRVRVGGEAVLAIRLDNRDDPVTGPKPLHLLDFNMYHGLYRYVHLVIKDPLHITDPIFADRPASGGVFVTFPQVTASAATVRVQTHVRNDHPAARDARVRTTLLTAGGEVVVQQLSAPATLDSGATSDVVVELLVRSPRLWSPRAPTLYVVRTELMSGGRVVDVEHERVGIRRIEIGAGGFRINGERLFLRGTNRHQEHPYVGHAVPANAQYRDARRIKDAGFDYVRLSHYPHSPAFMDACDELGLVVMNCIPGWQYFGPHPDFAALQYRNSRELIRRDRNRPSVILWEVSLNETDMPAEFIARTHALAKEEYPGDQCHTCGWVAGYDVLIRARQHGGCPPAGAHPCVVSEYGDWEYYAMTAGLNQEAWQGLTPDESNSRQLRWHGERAMLQQATNFQEGHNDNRAGAAFGDGLWVMYDYNRGYAPDIESSGCADIFRVPKYAYHFFRSQRPPGERSSQGAAGPMVFIASSWTPASSTRVRVFSNCDEVELRLDGRLLARRRPDRDRMSTHVAHPPFTFRVGRFVPGTLHAVGYIGGREAAQHVVRTPGPVTALTLEVDLAGREPSATGKDLLFCRALLRDARGTVVPDAWENVAFGVRGDATLQGVNPFSSDAGIASILVETSPAPRRCAVYAVGIVRTGRSTSIVGASLAVAGTAAPYELRFTTDGSAPDGRSALYSRAIAAPASVRAALLVDGRPVASLDERDARFRIRGSAAPSTRETFRRG